MRPAAIGAGAAGHTPQEGHPPPIQLVHRFEPGQRAENALAVLVVPNCGPALGNLEVLPKLHGVGFDLRPEVDEQLIDDVEASGYRALRAVLSALDTFGDPDFPLPVEQGNDAHLAEVHPHRVVRALDGARRQVEGGALGVPGLFVFLLGLVDGDAPFGQALQELLGRVVAPGLLNFFGQQIAAVFSERDERLDFVGLGFDSEITEQRQVVPGGFRVFHG